MYLKKPQIVGWGKLNLVHNVKEKMLKDHPKKWDERANKKPNTRTWAYTRS
jgi:hypothetical protein